MRKLSILFALFLALSGCAAAKLNALKGQSGIQVMKALGTPTLILPGEGGGQIWLYRDVTTSTSVSNSNYVPIQPSGGLGGAFAAGVANGLNKPTAETTTTTRETLVFLTKDGIVYDWSRTVR